jgi:DnaJ-class molecular chaperone
MSDEIEIKCDARNGTGFQVVMHPVQPGKKIYPPPCKKCVGKGGMKKAAN